MSSIPKFLNVKERCPSGTCSPVLAWSPLPQKRQLNFIKNSSSNNKNYNENKQPLYPNCDFTIWLRSCQEEIKFPIYGKISGEIPKWLNGSLIRNGPGSLKVADEEFTHLFDSSGLLHKFGIKNGEVTYQCRFLQSDVYKKNWKAKRIVHSEFGTKIVEDPCHSIFKRIATVFSKEVSDNSMISVYPFGDELYAFGETPMIHRIDSETLETKEKVNIGEYVSIVNHTSHPHVLKSGTVYNLGMSISSSGIYHNIVEFPQTETGFSKSMFEKARIVASVPARWRLHPSYMHSFGITDNYYIIVEQPLSISVLGLISSKLNNEPLAGCFRWYHEEYTRITVISRTNGEVFETFFSKSFFYLHIINQYEMDNHIVLDICMYKDPSMLDCMYIETMKTMQQNPDYAKMFRGRPARFVLPLEPIRDAAESRNLVTLKNVHAKAYYMSNKKILVEPEKLCDIGCETPRINYENYLGKPYRYFYAISADVDADNPGTLIKVDVSSHSTKTWCEKNCYPSEPIFVPSPDSKTEDEGVILSAMVWGEEDTNHVGLLILDAVTFTELGRADFQTLSPAPKCLHGWYLPSK
ncbi:carotenoid isomerooxygenase [Diorhabda sublineata]|uniref:carotenoid isomerooxygenase n=1 Tax=Diorhabda sublineata TaxID=1163346 RepID=UPI0024E176CD|nr:carotenoid isomerooxygenase [Diorhabda sublineata]